MKLKGKFKVMYLEYPTGQNNRFGAGGWSRNAQKPRPVVKSHTLTGKQIEFSGKSVILHTDSGDIRKLKCSIVRANNPKEVIREDYSISDLVILGI